MYHIAPKKKSSKNRRPGARRNNGVNWRRQSRTVGAVRGGLTVEVAI
jgi:hypothetical protein